MQTIQHATSEFLKHCLYEKNLSTKTIKAYFTDLKQLFLFIRRESFPEEISKITRNHLREYLTSISALKPKSVKRKIAVTKALFNYLEFEDRITVNPFRKMRIRIKVPHRLPTVLSLQEIVKIFKASYLAKEAIRNKDSYHYHEALRNTVVLELLFSTGARVSEIADLRNESLHLQTGSIIIRGKGNKERLIQICNRETLEVLKEYKSVFEKKIALAGGVFLVNRFGEKLSDQSIRNMVKSISKKAGLTRHITPHTFRHSFATLLLEKDVDIKYIQAMLGHSSIMTTQIYTHVNKERQRQILKTRHPRREFSLIS